MTFAIKAEVSDPSAETFEFSAQKRMYGGKHIAKGDTIFVFASENAMVDPRPSSISNSIVRQRTKSSPSRMKRRRSSANSSNASDFDMNTVWPDEVLEQTQYFAVGS